MPAPVSAEAEGSTHGRVLLETHFDLIQRQLRHLSWRSGLPDSEAEELRSWALFKLVDNNYRILGSWEGRSSFPTFLTVVLVNLMRDYRIHVWGKWRPSAASRRRGLESILLERLLVRDGLSGSEARERLQTEHGLSVSPDEVVRITSTLPRRQERRWVGEEELLRISIDGHVESRVEEKERAATVGRLHELLVPLLRSLPAEDRLLLKLHFLEDLSIAALAPILGRPQRQLYAARDRCLKKIRRSLAEAGLDSDQLHGLVGTIQDNFGLEAHLGT